MPDESLRVAVRVRPFNQREKDRQAKVIIEMVGQTTLISNPDQPNDEPKKFSFDYSYWSHDGFKALPDGTLEATSSKYASQQHVFRDLGQGVLDNAFQGYNCSLFAYGQTGSGKSYSLIGYGPNKGIVPITCDELFKAIATNTDKNKRFEVMFSMLEIYNEQVRDLLSKDNPKGGLPIRQDPNAGSFYVQGLKQVPVGSYIEISKRMEQGTASRTVASTNMNATSSRAHTLVIITFDQFIKTGGDETKKSSTMNLVDLAGSERADSSGATGDRLKEGANINKSLSALGNVISALADLSSGKKKIVVPYRDSALTKLLQNALGGNSKTVMIAALSPADINYDETLSTLRYADRAKRIKTKAIINENPLDKLIRDLKEENERLKKMIEGGGLAEEVRVEVESKGLTEQGMEKLRRQMMEEALAQLTANAEKIAETEGKGPTWEDKLNLARAESFVITNDDRKKKEPYLVNLNEDQLLSGVVFHFLKKKKGEITVGRKDAKIPPNICLNGLSIMKDHAVLTYSKREVEIRPAMPGAKTLINGQPLISPRLLIDKDRILFGNSHLYVFVNPKRPDTSADLPEPITWEFAQMEIAQARGFTTLDSSGLTKDRAMQQEQVLELLPLVSEVNAISEELNKYRSFEVVFVPVPGLDVINKGTKVMIMMKNLLNGNIWLWERGTFVNRRYLMQDMYEAMLDADIDVTKIPKEEDPFWEPVTDALIGTASIFLQSLAYSLDFEDTLVISDYKGADEGTIDVQVAPCLQNGRALGEEHYVDEPKELLDRPYHFKVTLRHAEITNTRYNKGVYVKYSVMDDDALTETPVVCTLTPKFNNRRVVTFNAITQEHIDYFESNCITFFVYGVQEDTLPDKRLAKMSTKDIRQMENMAVPKPSRMSERRMTIFPTDTSTPDPSQIKSEFVLQQRKYERLEQKEKRIQELCRDWSSRPEHERNFEPFFNAVKAVAFSTGTKLKTRVQLITMMLASQRAATKSPKSQMSNKSSLGSVNEDDEVTVYVFGEDEDKLESEAQKNGGYLQREHLASHYGDNNLQNLLETRQKVQQRRMSLIGGGRQSIAPGGSLPARDLAALQAVAAANQKRRRSPSPSPSTNSMTGRGGDGENRVENSRTCIIC